MTQDRKRAELIAKIRRGPRFHIRPPDGASFILISKSVPRAARIYFRSGAARL
jgi:hypothetical protein